MPHRRILVSLAAVAALAPAVGAQPAPVADEPWRVGLETHLAAGDTAGALAFMDSVGRRHPRDLAVAHATGMLAWDAVRPAKTTTMGLPLARIRLLELADTKLREAARGAPDEPRYTLALGRWFLYGNLSTLRVQAEGWIARAAAAARRSGDAAYMAEALDELGMIAWRSHENVARRRLLESGYGLSTGRNRGAEGLGDARGAQNLTAAEQLMQDQRVLREVVESRSHEITPPPGVDEAGVAMDRFREALRLVPWHPRAASHLAMALAEWERWEELHEFASEWARADAANAWGWASAGLAAQRLGRSAEAERMLDSALARLAPAEAARWTRLTRLTSVGDSARLAGRGAAGHAAFERTWWRLADPVTLTAENEVRAEFLARVAFAELRWTSEDFDRHGADTDRGNVHVRFGPPPTRFVLNAGSVNSLHVWWYPALRFGVVFDAMVGYGTARHGFGTERFVDDAREASPVRWDNVPVVASLDTILVQPVRFRGAADSTDLVVYASLPVERLLRGADLATATLATRFTTTRGNGVATTDVGGAEVVRRGDAAAARRTFRARLGVEALAMRVEAWQPASQRAARALTAVTPLPASGFGTSDLLVAERIAGREGGAATRWNELRVVPGTGQLRAGQPLAVAWETYALGDSAGTSRYEVSLDLVLEEIDRTRARDPVGTLVARVIGGAADAIGLTSEGEARVSLRYRRSRTASPVALDWVALELGEAPRGTYSLAVTVRDLVTGAHATTTRRLRVVP